ncbi:DUF2142 domain-containing protein [Ruminococcaceae bacterium OttesenSCG-928-O06]|nr:DUF2142 domain-containing protein [Ruminococcaceae bacterium OttesenSCG-928-O06]
MQTTTEANKKKLPAAARWLIGYAAVLAACVGLVYYWRVAFMLTQLNALPFTLAVMGVFSLLYLALFFICRAKDISLRAALCVFCLGVVFCFATAPLQAPDEGAHYLRAAAISTGHFTYNYDEDWPEDIDLLRQHFPFFMNHTVAYQNGQLTPARLEAYFADVQNGATAEKPADAPILFMLLPFLHQGPFMAVARLFGGGALAMLYAGRMANLALYSLLCYFTFRGCARFRGVFIAVAMLPVSLFMAASCSYDGPMLALCFFLVSYVCRRQVTGRDVVLFCVLLCLAVYIKPNNFVLAGVLLLVPKAAWQCRFKRWMVLAGMLAAAAVFYFATGALNTSGFMLQGYPEELPRGEGTGPLAQLLFVLKNPPRFLATALLSIYEADGFLFDLGRLGSMDLVVPLAGGLSVISLVVASALSIRQKEDAKPGAVWGLFLVGLIYAAAVLAGIYVTQTGVGSVRIVGLQPRYFLPTFLLWGLVGSMLLGKAVRPRLDAASPLAHTEDITLWIAAAAALLAGVLLFQNYFVGQWLQTADGSHKLVNMFGWVIGGAAG